MNDITVGNDGGPFAISVPAQGPQGSTGAGYACSSTTSLVAAGSGSKSFTTQAGLAYSTGARIRATSAGTGDWMEGVVTSYSGTSLVATMDLNSGTGTHADWTINLAGARGPTGATGAGYAAASTTSLVTAGSGSKSFTVAAGLAYSTGARIRATSAGTGEWMEGVVTSYSGTTLAVTMDLNSGTGTNADWNINLAGARGATGVGDMLAANNLSDLANKATARTNLGVAIGSDVMPAVTSSALPVGTYAYLVQLTGGALAGGATVAGSNVFINANVGGTAQSGTWTNLGAASIGNGSPGLLLRTA